jgi:hypothetical protein
VSVSDAFPCQVCNDPACTSITTSLPDGPLVFHFFTDEGNCLPGAKAARHRCVGFLKTPDKSVEKSVDHFTPTIFQSDEFKEGKHFSARFDAFIDKVIEAVLTLKLQ